MKKKLVSAILCMVFVCTCAAGMLCGCGVKGQLYTLQEAYENGWLTEGDLLSIAYYHNRGRRYNEELMSENYEPIPKEPAELSEDMQDDILDCVSEKHEENRRYHTLSVTEYDGTYGDCIAFEWDCQDCGHLAYMYVATIGNVNFYYASETIEIWRNI